MGDPRDIVEVDGLGAREGGKPGGASRSRSHTRPFLSIWFRCCHVYGRIYRNRDETEYEGRCPRCGAHVSALIGPNGTSRRIFEAR